MGYNPQESLENIINTMGTPLGVHPIVPWYIEEFNLSPVQKLHCNIQYYNNHIYVDM